jgi:hypothetical protein
MLFCLELDQSRRPRHAQLSEASEGIAILTRGTFLFIPEKVPIHVDSTDRAQELLYLKNNI